MPEYTRRYTFFESFYRATKYMSDEQELAFRRAIDEFAFEGIEPEFSDPLLLSNWEQICTTLVRSMRFSEAGSKGANKRASKGVNNPPKGACKGASKHKECKGEECKEEKGDALDRMYSQRVRVVPVEEVS